MTNIYIKILQIWKKNLWNASFFHIIIFLDLFLQSL